MYRKVFSLLIVASLGGTVLADRPLERTEVLQIFEVLTSKPHKTWIPAGTISARHQEYKAPKTKNPKEIADRIDQEVKAYLKNPNKLELTEKLQRMKLEAIPFNVRYRLSNEYTMNSNVVVKFDGSSFYWGIDVDSRTDSVKRPAELAGNSLTEGFNLEWNQKRVFAWDGEKYTTYFRPGNHATITDTPSGINGPLIAGVIPWGYGPYSYVSLSSAQSSATEVKSGGQSEIHLTIMNDDKQETFILDPLMGYAVKFYSTNVGNTSTIEHDYSNYQLVVGDKWCPGRVIIERYDTTTNPAKLMARDIWDFISISNGTPEPGSFSVDYDYDAFIEDYRFGPVPLQYRYLPPQKPSVKDIYLEQLLQKRLEIAYLPPSAAQNCATISLKYVCGKLGFNPSWEGLNQLVHGQEKRTTLFEMQQFVHNLGLNSLAVKTVLETLKTLGNCQVILHLARDNHYVVLGNMDDRYIRLINLAENNFCCRKTIEHFGNEWDGTALVVANEPIALKGNVARIDNSQLHEIIGAGECQSCTKKIQSSADFPCQSIAGDCGGTHTIYYERYGCEKASSGSCSESSMIGSKSEPCGEDPNDPTNCTGSGEWTSSSISACG